MKLVPPTPEPPISSREFPDIARTHWLTAKAAYGRVHHQTGALFDLIHRPGRVQVAGQVTGALHAAKQLRDEADALVLALGEIVQAGRRVDGAS